MMLEFSKGDGLSPTYGTLMVVGCKGMRIDTLLPQKQTGHYQKRCNSKLEFWLEHTIGEPRSRLKRWLKRSLVTMYSMPGLNAHCENVMSL